MKILLKKSKYQKLTWLALGLKKLIMGMIKKVSHLLLRNNENNENYDIK
ncbi:uL30 family ribosomal protein [Candidatus Karelsulcia muelleri]|nr:hypothetical protein [Candidatus Karelsulcia muelleri]